MKRRRVGESVSSYRCDSGCNLDPDSAHPARAGLSASDGPEVWGPVDALELGFEKSYFGTPDAARDFVRLARRPGPIADAGDGISRRLLVCGPRGSGKKTLARAVAAELGVGFVSLKLEETQVSEHLRARLARLDATAQAMQAPIVVYFELAGCARWVPEPEATLPAYDRWLQAWTSGAPRHLLLVVGVSDPRWVDGELEDVVVLQCNLSSPRAPVRQKLWEHALARACPGQAVDLGLDAETFDKVVVRPSEGLHGGDIERAVSYAVRLAVTALPDASAVTLTQDHLRAAIARRQLLQLERPGSSFNRLQI